jgi:hypothetical protein
MVAMAISWSVVGWLAATTAFRGAPAIVATGIAFLVSWAVVPVSTMLGDAAVRPTPAPVPAAD